MCLSLWDVKTYLISLCLCLSGLITPGGFSSVPAGMETPELIELRKKKIEEAMDGWVREKSKGDMCVRCGQMSPKFLDCCV